MLLLRVPYVCIRFRTEARAAGHVKSHLLSREQREEAELAEMKKVTIDCCGCCSGAETEMAKVESLWSKL